MLALTDILGLIANEPYELSTLLSLERYVGMQLNEGEYDFEANKALLRSYQVNAEHVKLDVVVNTMVLSLMRLPSTDFLALSYIIPGKLPLQPKLKQVQKFADLLERAEFSKFWEEYAAADQSITSSANGFKDLIRTFIISNTSATFTNISMELLQSFLGLSASETVAFCKTSPLVEQVTFSFCFYSQKSSLYLYLDIT
jgi:translation initiation factor 3 subunit K